MQKVEFYYTREIIASIPSDNVLFCLHCSFPRVDSPAYTKVSDNKKIKVTQWTTLFFSPLSSVFVRAHRYSQRTRQAKKQKDLKKKNIKMKGLLYLCYNLSCGPHFLLKSSLSVEVKCESTE